MILFNNTIRKPRKFIVYKNNKLTDEVEYQCPHCKNLLLVYKQTFCHHCGIKLNWN